MARTIAFDLTCLHTFNANIKSFFSFAEVFQLAGFSELVGYASTKSALEGLTKSFAIEMANKNIRANIINTGFIKTSYFKQFKKRKKLYNWTLARTSLKRWGEPKEVAGMINYLLSDKSNYITGESIYVDGGWIS